MSGPHLKTGLEPAQLRRVLTFWPLLFYGLGVIIGAGIYVALGEVISRAGSAAPLSFFLAGLCAALTGVCYAELAGRFPEAAGAAAYAKKAFSSDILGIVVGLTTTITAAVAAAAIAHGAVSYIDQWINFSQKWLVAGLIISFGFLAAYGVKASVSIAAFFGLIEIFGLAGAFGMGLYRADTSVITTLFDASSVSWSGIIAGAFIAFFAYVGFETIANMAEEVDEPHKTVPRVIIACVLVSLCIYVAVALAAIMGGAVGDSPLASLFHGRWALIFSALVFLTIANGTLVQINMLARLFYGMARLGELPKRIATVNAQTGTPLLATALAVTIILMTAILFDFRSLLVIVNFLTLAIFIVVDLALVKLHRLSPLVSGFRAPRFVPVLAALLSLGMVMAELVLMLRH